MTAKTPLDEVIEEFINDHVELFYAIWRDDDMPSDADMDTISDAWYDKYEPDISWGDVETRLGELAMEYDWDIGWDEDDGQPIYPGHIVELYIGGEEE